VVRPISRDRVSDTLGVIAQSTRMDVVGRASRAPKAKELSIRCECAGSCGGGVTMRAPRLRHDPSPLCREGRERSEGPGEGWFFTNRPLGTSETLC